MWQGALDCTFLARRVYSMSLLTLCMIVIVLRSIPCQTESVLSALSFLCSSSHTVRRDSLTTWRKFSLALLRQFNDFVYVHSCNEEKL